ncbi:MAG: response regulator [Rhodospirillaceae bacterium]|nr:response regulator [Rhodospirillaceae bacterium]
MTPGPAVLTASSKILIVDDLPDMRAALHGILKDLGFGNTLSANDGSAARRIVEANRDIALVISDWNMAPMDGLALLAGLRKDAQLRLVPFILVSAEAGPYRKNQAMEAGVSLFLPKPLDAEMLRRALTDIGLM